MESFSTETFVVVSLIGIVLLIGALLSGLIERSGVPQVAVRFDLFMLIVLGETIVGVVVGLAEQELFTLWTGLMGALPVVGLLLLLVCTQIIYGTYVWFHTPPAADSMTLEGNETAQVSS